MKHTLWLSAALIAALSSAPVHAEEATLRAASAFGLGTAFSKPFETFVDWVNENGKGKVQIDLVGGPEAVPPFELGNAVSSGVVDMGNLPAGFYTNLVPEGDALKLSTNTVEDQRANGCFELIDNLHQEKMGVKYLARFGDQVPFHLYLTKPIDGPDLSGLTIRTTPTYQAFFEALGANLVRTAPGDVYTALERGTIDGYGWPIQGVLDLGWDEQTKFRVDPAFYHVEVGVIVNLDTWNSLTDDQKAFLEEAAAVLDKQNAESVAVNEAEDARQREAGIEIIEFTGDDAKTWLDTAYAEGWKHHEELNPAFAKKMKACF